MGNVYRSMLFSRFIPPSLSPAASTSLLSTSVTLFLPSKQVHLYHFSRFYIYVFIYDTCFSLPDLLHSVWQTLRQSTAQQMTQFVTFYGWVIFLCNVPHLWVSRVVLVVENPPADGREVKDSGSVPGSGKCPGGEHGNPLQYSCLENPVDRGAWWLMVHRVTKSWTQLKRISTHTYHIFFIYSFVSGYLSYFYVLDIVNILQWTLECMWSFLLSSIQFSYNRPVKLQSSN